MIALVSIGLNGILTVLVGYNIVRYSKGDPTLVLLAVGYGIVVAVSIFMLIGNAFTL